MKLYRIRYSDNSVSAWSKDYNKTKKSADFFKAKIEVKEIKK